MKIPPSIAALIKEKHGVPNKVGLSGAQVLCFDDMVLKVQPISTESEREQDMLRFLQGKLPVPRLLAAEKAAGMHYILMERIPGEMACAAHVLADPATVTGLLAQALRMLWQVDISCCPYSSMLDEKLRLAEIQVRSGLVDMENCQPDTYGPGGFSGPEELFEWLRRNRPEETPVLSHGDFCLPNVFLLDGQVSGFLDLGRCGVGDPYQDIALCYRSLQGNLAGHYGGVPIPDFPAETLFTALNMEPDWEKIRYYILLDELF